VKKQKLSTFKKDKNVKVLSKKLTLKVQGKGTTISNPEGNGMDGWF